MSEQCLKLICNDEFEIVKITENLYDEAIELFQTEFAKYENLNIAFNLIDCKDPRDDKFIRLLLKDNISFAARHIRTQQLVAICINRIATPCLTKETGGEVPNPKLQKIGEIIHHMTTSRDVYKEWQVKCTIELTFLSTRNEFTRRGLALNLVEYTLDYARKLKEENSKEALELPTHLKDQRPEAVTAVFTSRFSQRIGEKLGFVTLFREEYTKFSFEGKTLAEKIDPEHMYIIFVAKRL
uniref:N-acetyltransferase domain-containing protein n=1 Tax=Glossina brevipalpis TaxID=37001 RepID=A0A1A9WRU5_9MUSC